ncbi:MAG: ABC transporter permease [Actinomycetia bacterium]|nr:ABC transporter permease [Actinomycetes bacterium]
MENAVIENNGSGRQRTAFSRGLTGVYVLWLRELKRFWRDKPRRLGAFFQPLIYLFLLGTGMQAAFTVFGGGKIDYVTFMYPGILAMTILFTSVFSAISILWDRQFGFLKEVLVSPIPRTSVAVGKIVGGATTACLQGIILMILAFVPSLLGFSLSTLGKVLTLIPVVILLSLCMTSMGVAIAARMKSFEAFPIIMNFILLPMFFLSGSMFPLQGLPGWMDVLTKMNPLTYGVDLLRGIALSSVDVGGLKAQAFPAWLDVLVMIVFGAVMAWISIWQFNRQD